MFSNAVTPNPTTMPKQVRDALTAFTKARDTAQDVQAKLGAASSEAAVQIAAMEDDRAFRAALANGSSETVVPAAEYRRSASVAALKRSALLADTDAQEAAANLAHVLGEHRDVVIGHVKQAVPAAAEKYTQAVEAFIAARQQYDGALELVVWAYAVDGADVPHLGESTPRFTNGFVDLNEFEVFALLRDDTVRHEEAAKAEAERARRQAADERADAINKAEGDRLRADLEVAAARRFEAFNPHHKLPASVGSSSDD